jgi:hypothetical protein
MTIVPLPNEPRQALPEVPQLIPPTFEVTEPFAGWGEIDSSVLTLWMRVLLVLVLKFPSPL